MIFAAFLLIGCGACRQETAQPEAACTDIAEYAAAWAAPLDGMPAEVCALLIHDHLIRSVTYAPDAERRHTAAGALLDGRAVCDGYAAGFAALCKACAVPCLTVTGTACGVLHAWNLIRLAGIWYHADCAADDADAGAPLHTYFLRCDAEMTGYAWDRAAYPAAEKGTLDYPAVVYRMGFVKYAENPAGT